MITFETKKTRNCKSANCFGRNYQSKKLTTEPKDKHNISKNSNQKQKQNFKPEFENFKPALTVIDPFTQQMKFLIDQNADYYQSKMRITDKIRPNQYRFKIPTKTPTTLYKKHYDQKNKDLSVDNVKLNRNMLSETIKKNQPQKKLLLSTTYEQQFGAKSKSRISKKNTCFISRKDKQNQQDFEYQVPRFFQTQNNRFFLNWGGFNSASSLKPSHQYVGVKIPFDGKTTYKNDFQGKPANPTKLATHQSTLSKFGSPFMIKGSCYARDFSSKNKKVEKQKSCKPQHEDLMTRSTNFMGKTEYRSQFIEVSGQAGSSFEIDKKELKNLMMGL